MADISFTIIAINISQEKGVQKTPIDSAVLIADHGIEGDAHAGPWHRQVSLLADEDIESMRGKGVELTPGDFAENFTTRGIPVGDLAIGTRIFIDDAELEVTQIGKECHHGCAIFQTVGDCVMPRKGAFAKVIQSGTISASSSCRYESRIT
ncbi:MAG: MOSC domain-containing protein [Spirochaetales bacterium]|jgi:MOSC domain-containing protein YiiM|nr:MOSC domain-containing protein [Spirochaetales bacterium]